jgi:hypothetical protein
MVNGHLQVVVADFEERQSRESGMTVKKGAETTNTTAPAMQFATCYVVLFFSFI